MKLLLTADIHIGRTSSCLPASVSLDEGRATAAWLRLVELARAEGVAAVCLSGDVADADNRFWEAIGPLEEGVRRLAESGIRTVAVAGNHDHEVLARLAAQMDGDHFVLLGEGGRWERLTLEEQGQPRLHIDGWSFPRRQVRRSPLESYTPEPTSPLPVLGMVHGDLDVVDSPYAPLSRVHLESQGVGGWLLGHIHSPRLLNAQARPWLLYPGSPQSMDPGEPGMHGPWLVEVGPAGMGVPEQVPVSSICYHGCSVDVSGVEDEQTLESRLLDAVRAESSKLAEAGGESLRAISLRVRLSGRSPLAPKARRLAEAVVSGLRLQVAQAVVAIEKLEVEALPPIDLEEHASRHTAAGAVARLLLELERNDSGGADEPGEAVAEVLRRARGAMERVDGHRDFANLPHERVSDEQVRARLASEARALLSELMSQVS